MSTPPNALASFALCAALLAAAAAAASARTPLTLRLLPHQPPAAATAEITGQRAASAAERLVQVERESRDEQAGRRPVPAGATPEQVLEIGTLLRRTAALLQTQVDVEAEIAAVKLTREDAERASAAWQHFDEPGPWSVAQLDPLFDDLDAERTRLRTLQSVAKLGAGELERLELSYKELQSEQRVAFERAEAEPARLELAKLRTQRAGEVIELLRLQAQLNAELELESLARVALLNKQIAAVRASFRFDAADLKREIAEIEARAATLDRRVDDTVAARAVAGDERDSARAEVNALASPATPDEQRRRALADARLNAANVTLDALRAQYSALTALRGIAPVAIALWNQRYALATHQPGPRGEMISALEGALARMQVLHSYSGDLALLAETLQQEQQRRVERLSHDAPARGYEEAALARARAARDVVGELQFATRQVRSASDHWVSELKLRDEQRPAGERLADAWSQTKDAARSVWDFELFAVEDTIVIGGRPTTVERAVTIGKSIGALLIFVVGYAVAGALTRRAQRVLVAKMGVATGQAKVLGRWIMIIVGFILLVITLNLARIPLTVFAFLGGALAIGVGFGMQTLLKNLISGIMVLIERKVRVGDVVEVGGVQGVVTAVDVRSTTLRQSDGIETMVPNALLLEQQVTNWTGESPTMRRAVTISVPYGSPVRQVADVLAATAAEHGLVLKDPPPQVIFAEFGDAALQFALYFWIDISKYSGMQVQSDLRFMLEKRLADAGIPITSPRDVRVTGLPPLRVDGDGGIVVGAAPGRIAAEGA